MADIAETRVQMDGTLDELSARLQPRHILDDILDYFRSHRSSPETKQRVRNAAGKAAGKVNKAAGQVKAKAGDAGRVAVRQVREHPLPALLIGAGISLFLMERNRGHEYEEYDSEMMDQGYGELETLEGVGPESFVLPHHYTGESEVESGGSGMMNKLKGKGSEMKERAGTSLQNMKDRTSEKAHALRRRAGEKGAVLKNKARHGYEHSRETFVRTADERPLAVGLGFLAIGMVAGMLLPSTRKEDELVGETRDRLVNRSREAAQDAMERGKHVARTALDTAKQVAEEQGLTPGALKEKTQAVASQVKETTRDEAQRQQQEFTQELKQS